MPKGGIVIKRLAVFSLTLLMLFGCTSPKASETPQTPVPDQSTASALPQGSGIDWNKTITGGGNAVRPASFEPLYCITAFNPPQTFDDISIEGGKTWVSVNRPVFSCFADGDVNKKVNAVINELVDEYMADIEKVFDVQDVPEENLYYSKNGWANFYVEIIGNYINIGFERMINCYTYATDSEGYEIYGEQVYMEYSTVPYCLDLKTGERLKIEDVFYSDCDLGKLLGVSVASGLEAWDTSLKRPFRGLPADYTDFRFTSAGELEIQLPDSNPYTAYSAAIAIPLWELRENVLFEDTDMSLFKDLSSEDYEDFTATPYTHYLTNTDFTVVTLQKEDRDIMQITQHKAGDYALDSINPVLEKMCVDIWDKLPDGVEFDYEPALNKECYISVNLVSVTLALSYSIDDTWYIAEERATFDVQTGKRLTAGDVILFMDGLDETLSYLEEPMPDNIKESVNVGLNQYGTAVVGWNNGKNSAFIERQFVNTSLWRNIK